MKNIIILSMAVLLGTSCQQIEERLARSSDEIDVVKNLIQDFQESNWEDQTKHYSSDALIYHNDWQTGSTVNETKKFLKSILADATSYKFNKPLIFENARNDSGKITGVHFWATLSINTKQGAIEMPMHLSFHMDEGKISGEYGFYNLSILDKNSQEHPIKEQIK